mmetsp:Transcript_68386/g.113676  ORF Transcript_68386/g.113676 Transcript_68386/m.113676 type:complete len:112 (-) Transcript_68386:182-517(-)
MTMTLAKVTAILLPGGYGDGERDSLYEDKKTTLYPFQTPTTIILATKLRHMHCTCHDTFLASYLHERLNADPTFETFPADSRGTSSMYDFCHLNIYYCLACFTALLQLDCW